MPDGERRRMTVGGEESEVSQPHGSPGAHDFTWLTRRARVRVQVLIDLPACPVAVTAGFSDEHAGDLLDGLLPLFAEPLGERGLAIGEPGPAPAAPSAGSCGGLSPSFVFATISSG